MNSRFYVIPLRNDLQGVNIQVTDLRPNNSQKNNVLDGEGQTFYVDACLDIPGPTETKDGYFLRGSLNTLLSSSLDAPAIVDTTGGGDDAVATPRTTFGLAAYVKERVAKANGDVLGIKAANDIAAAILDAVVNGDSLTANDLDGIIAAEGGEVLSGGTYDAFGSVEDILRILSGEVYVCPQNLLFGDDGDVFEGLTWRENLVAAQDPVANGGVTYVATGRFLEPTEPQFKARPKLIASGIAQASAMNGQLKGFLSRPFVVKNPAFTYGSGGSAKKVNGDPIGSDGSAFLFTLYDGDGGSISSYTP